jgi:hypothetical protein
VDNFLFACVYSGFFQEGIAPVGGSAIEQLLIITKLRWS